MSDAPAAPVNENGVPPAAQETVVEEAGFKVRTARDAARDVAHPHPFPAFYSRFLPAILRTLPRMKG